MSEYLQQLNVRVSPGVKATLSEFSWQDRKSLNQFMVDLIEDYIRERLLNEK